MTFTAIHEKIEDPYIPENDDSEKEENTDIVKTNANANTMTYWVFVIPVLLGITF